MNDVRPVETYVWREVQPPSPARPHASVNRIYSPSFYLSGSRWRLLTQQAIGATNLSVYVELVQQVAPGTLWQIYMRLRHPSKLDARHSAWQTTSHVFSEQSPNQGFASLGALKDFSHADTHLVEVEFTCKAAPEEFQVRDDAELVIAQQQHDQRVHEAEQARLAVGAGAAAAAAAGRPAAKNVMRDYDRAYIANLDPADRAEIEALLKDGGDAAKAGHKKMAADVNEVEEEEEDVRILPSPQTLDKMDHTSVVSVEKHTVAACTACLEFVPNTVTRCCGMVRVCSPCMRDLLSHKERQPACPNCNRAPFGDTQVVWHLRY